MYYLEKEFWICCSHRLHNIELTDEENKELFCKCYTNHGHNYKIILGLESKRLKQTTGMIVNFYDLKKIFNDVIDIPFDHKCLNECLEFKDIIPTAENMCKIFFDLLKPYIDELYSIKIYETSGSSAQYVE